MWSYRNDRSDEIYGNVSGPAAVTTTELPRPPRDGEDIPEVPPVTVTSSNLWVAGGGSTLCVGAYAYEDANRWTKSVGGFEVRRSTQYPEPGVPWWIICQDTNVLYQAPDCPFPWDATWEVSSFGDPPIPTVTEITARGRAQ